MIVIRLICVSLIFLIPVSAQSILDQTDNQQWTDVQLAVPVTTQFDFNLLGTLRFGRDISHTIDERVGAGFTFRVNKYVSLSPNYVHIGMQPFAGRRIWENRLTLPVTLRFNLGDFRLSERNQVEWRLRNSGAKSTRYRNRFQVEHPIGPDDLALSLFVADEVFYDWTVNAWVRNRFSVGGSKVFNKHFTQEIYYLRQNDSFSVPGDLHVIGTTLRFRL